MQFTHPFLCMLKDELRLIAQQQEIDIIPLTSMPVLHMIETDYGPFSPNIPTRVPIHIAIFMSKSNLCRIPLPHYLSPTYLQEIRQKETENDSEYASIYPYIFELYDDILNCINENVEESRLLINDIKEIRMRKSRNGLVNIDGHALNLNNLTVYEYEEIKEMLLDGMEMALKMNDANHK